MKRAFRVLLIGRRFWPHGSSDSACFLTELAGALRRGGMHVEVLTPRYASSWPENLVVREIPVHRPTAAPRSDWSIARYLKHTTTWLRQHAAGFDALLVDAIREESIVVTEVAKQLGIPVLLRCSGWGENSDSKWWSSSRAAKRCCNIAKTANAVVIKNGIQQRELISEGFSPATTHRISDGFPAFAPRTVATKHAARKALAAVNADLSTVETTPVILCTSPMTRNGGINLLVKAAPHLINRYPDLRIWFIGDGPYRDWIYESLRGDGIRASIAMPGSFSDFTELCQAADVFFQPDDNGLDYFLPTAVAAELPVVCLKTGATEALFRPGLPSPTQSPADNALQNLPDMESLVHWFDPSTPKQVRLACVDVLDDLTLAQQKATELRRILVRANPRSESVQSYIHLLGKLAQHPQTDTSSTETVS